jgi:hypothetical protein
MQRCLTIQKMPIFAALSVELQKVENLCIGNSTSRQMLTRFIITVRQSTGKLAFMVLTTFSSYTVKKIS